MNRRERRAADKAGGQATTAALRRAWLLSQSGKLVEAERAYRAILSRAPRDAHALNQLGILMGQRGRLPEAERCLAEACEIEPDKPTFHHSLGWLRALQGRHRDALAAHDKVLALDATHVGALVGRADALQELGRLTDAEATYRRAAVLAPLVPEIRFGWATALADLSRLPEAEKAYREVLALSPDSAEARVNLGTVLRDLDRLDEAAGEFQRALALKPDVAHALVELVSALVALGRSAEAMDRAASAMRQQPDSSDGRRAFVLVVARCGPLPRSPAIAALLERCLSAEDVDHDDLARACAWQLRQGLDPSPREAAGAAFDSALAGDVPDRLVDPLLLKLLVTTVNTDLALEQFLTEARRRLCLAVDLPAGLRPFVAALALQGFNNGYIFAISDEEEARVDALHTDLDDTLSRATALDTTLEWKLLRFALYEPLTALKAASAIVGLAVPSDSPLGTVVARCLSEPLEEAAIGREITSLGTIENEVSRAVRDQYEEHPYPRWLSTPRPSPGTLGAMLRRKFPWAVLPPIVDGPIDILVAGCGTGRQPIVTALSLAPARVLAVDLSRASLAYAKRMARRLGVHNVDFLQADLLSLGQLEREFDVIEAAGVLHHMEDPMAGWRILLGLLKPGGLMRIGLYSAIARADVIAARERIAALGLEPTPRDIRAFRRRALLGEDDERLPRLAHSRDMFDLNGSRDLLFHAKEHRYSLLQIGDLLKALELRFVGFEFASAEPARGYQLANPADRTMTDLAAWDRYEADHPETFAGMYVFWCCRQG